MWTKKELIIFFAGAETFHTLSHILLYWSVPFTFWGITISPALNMWAIIINAAVTIWLFMWLKQLQK
jgi:hypothetical protein